LKGFNVEFSHILKGYSDEFSCNPVVTDELTSFGAERHIILSSCVWPQCKFTLSADH